MGWIQGAVTAHNTSLFNRMVSFCRKLFSTRLQPKAVAMTYGELLQETSALQCFYQVGKVSL
jgi:hypothetical protein